LLQAAERARLEALLTERERATGTQMVIAIFPSLEGESLEDYSIRLAQQWRIGQKALDNGVILLLFVQERKVRLEVGYGLEPIVPDAVAGQIVREVIAPRFRERRYAAGLEGAINAVFERVTAAKVSPEHQARAARPASSSSPLWPFVGFVVVLVVIAIVLAREAASARRFVRGHAYTAGRQGWNVPIVMVPPLGGGGWGGGGGDAGFSGGGGEFGGGGASGEW
jgi:uncharacterized protein